MGRPLMIQEDDDRRIERLKRVLGIDTKVDVLRAGMDLLEAEAERRARAARWRQAAGRVAATSHRMNTELRAHSRRRWLTRDR